MHGSTGSQHPPPLVPRSVHSMTLGHSQGRHAVQDLAANSGFDPLTLQRAGPDHRTDDGLVPTHRGFGQTSLAVAGPGVPWAFAEARSFLLNLGAIAAALAMTLVRHATVLSESSADGISSIR